VLSFDGEGYQDNAQPVNYLESHDEERIVHEVMTNRAIDEPLALRKSMLGAIVLFTAQGVPMLYHGQEFGAHARKTIEVNKIPWEYMQGKAGQQLYRHYATLAYLRHTQAALQHNNFAVLLADNERKVLVYHRWDDGGSSVVVAVNLARETQHVAFGFPRAGRWHEWLHNYDEDVGEEPRDVEVPGSFGKIWVFQG